MDKYQFSMALKNLYGFVYDDFCGHFLEMSKVSMNLESPTRKENTKQVLFRVLKDIIIMMSPYTPFIAEELYLSLPVHQDTVMLEKFPEVYKTKVSRQDEVAVEELYQAIQDIRNYKVERDLAPNHPLNIKIRANKEPFADFSKYLARFAFAKRIVIDDEIEVQGSDISFIYSCFDIVVEESINREEALKKLNGEKEKLLFEINRSKGMLANEKFIAKAPKDKINLEKEKFQKNNDLLAIVIKKIDKLK
jgi:valyl-tRNA synthetase